MQELLVIIGDLEASRRFLLQRVAELEARLKELEGEDPVADAPESHK